MNGKSVIHQPDSSKTADMCRFLYAVRVANGDRKIVMVLDNGPIHRAGDTLATAELLGIDLVFLPPYSPQFNPIESIWKTIKARISNMFLLHRDHLVAAVQEIFETESKKGQLLRSMEGDFFYELCFKIVWFVTIER